MSRPELCSFLLIMNDLFKEKLKVKNNYEYFSKVFKSLILRKTEVFRLLYIHVYDRRCMLY